jgi:hypothetical protein
MVWWLRLSGLGRPIIMLKAIKEGCVFFPTRTSKQDLREALFVSLGKMHPATHLYD